MGGQTLNGQYAQQAVSAPPPPPPAGMMETPIAYYQPIAITPGLIKWVIGAFSAVVVAVTAMPAADKYLNPASAKDLTAVQQLVQVLQTGLAEQKSITQQIAMEQKLASDRMTMAIDNLSGMVSEIRAGTQKIVVPAAKRVLTPRAQ